MIAYLAPHKIELEYKTLSIDFFGTSYAGSLGNWWLWVKSKNFTALSRLWCTLVLIPRSVFLDNTSSSNCPKYITGFAGHIIFEIQYKIVTKVQICFVVMLWHLILITSTLCSDRCLVCGCIWWSATDSICIKSLSWMSETENVRRQDICHNTGNAAC